MDAVLDHGLRFKATHAQPPDRRMPGPSTGPSRIRAPARLRGDRAPRRRHRAGPRGAPARGRCGPSGSSAAGGTHHACTSRATGRRGELGRLEPRRRGDLSRPVRPPLGGAVKPPGASGQGRRPPRGRVPSLLYASASSSRLGEDSHTGRFQNTASAPRRPERLARAQVAHLRRDPVPRLRREHELEAPPAGLQCSNSLCSIVTFPWPAQLRRATSAISALGSSATIFETALRKQRRRLAGPCAHLERTVDSPAPENAQHVLDQLGRVARPSEVIELGHVSERKPSFTRHLPKSISAARGTIAGR